MPGRCGVRPADLAPLYPSEAELAVLVFGRARAGQWPAVASVLEKRGLPPINPRYGGRFWPAVVRFFHIEEGLEHGTTRGTPTAERGRSVRIVPFAPDGRESFQESCQESVPCRESASRSRSRA
jgi:hypothetical protein